jgi:hypothetical protein
MKMLWETQESGIAEILGSLMLIAIIGLGIAIAGVYLLNHSVNEKIPEFRASLSNSSTNLILQHDGGDSIPRSNLKILVNGNPTNYVSSNALSPDWSIDDTLTFFSYDPATPLPDVKIVYNGPAGERVMADFGSVISSTVPTHTATPTTTSTTTPTPTQTIYTITSSAGSGGSISPLGGINVNIGANQTFDITPNSGYSIANVVVDGISQGIRTNYTFTNVQGPHTISATFVVATTYTITASAGTGGTMAPSGTVIVASGNSQTFTIGNSTGYFISKVLVDGVDKGAITSYTFTNVIANHTISASFATSTYIIMASAGTGGTISPAGSVSVNYGNSQTFTISPDLKYHIQTLVVDGVTTTYPPNIASTYSFSTVQANHTISVTFALNPRQDIFYDGFETGDLAGWTQSGSVDWYTGTPKIGTHGVRVLGGRGNNDGSILRTISTRGYSDINVTYYLGAYSLDNIGEYVHAQYSTNGGTSYTDMTIIYGKITTLTWQMYAPSTLPTSSNNNANFQIRLRIQASKDNDDGYFDEVRVTGIPYIL